MLRDLESVGHDVGLLLHVPAAMALVSLPVALGVGDRHAVVPLLATAAASGTIGFVLVRRFRHARTERAWPAVEVVALGWLLVGLISAVVFWGVAVAGDGRDPADLLFLDPWNAVFEAMSGITSTGLSMAGGREPELSAILQWWRSLLQWVGAIGVVLFAIGFTHTSSGIRMLYEAEGRSDDLGTDVGSTVRRTWAVYLLLTVGAVAAMLATEHTPWAALNHGLTALSTGGFSVTADSLAGYGPGTKVVTAGIMVIGAISFTGHYILLAQGDLRGWWRLTPVRAQAAVLVVGGASMLAAHAGSQLGVVDRIFEWVSASATAGLTTVPDRSGWGLPALLLVVVGMAIGAPSGSTGGGIKLDRVAWLVKDASARLLPARRRVMWDGAPVDPSTRASAVEHAAAITVLWVATIAVGVAMVAALTDAPVRNVLFDVTSALSNVGLDTGVVDPALSGTTKAVFTGLMFLGRLELLVALTFASQREHAP